MSIDQEIMRPTLLPGMLKAVSYNINRKAKRLSLFEIGKSYGEKKGSYVEEAVLSVGLAGIKERAGMLKGRIKIDSSPGKGTAVILIFPINK